MAVSTAYVNQILPKDAARVAIPGHVIQIQQGTLTTQTESSAAVNVSVDINLYVSITPTYSTSKIRITLGSLSLRTRDGNTYGCMFLERSINGGSYSKIVSFAEYFGDASNATYGKQEVYPTLDYIDTPNTTSSISYRITGTKVNGSANIAYHHNWSGTGGAYNKATLTAQEIAQ